MRYLIPNVSVVHIPTYVLASLNWNLIILVRLYAVSCVVNYLLCYMMVV